MTDETHKTATAAGWKKAGLHYPLLPSGERVGIRIPDLAQMIESGDIPQHLLDAALEAAQPNPNPEPPTKEKILQQHEWTKALVLMSVVEPKLSDSDYKDIPTEDKEFIVAIATRARDLDAEGEHIAGLTKSEKFRRFRGLGEFDPALEGLSGGG
jgi:hypothetical protein